MAYASGLGASVGVAQETTVGTQVTPDRWYEFLDASPQLNPTYLDSAGLKVNQAYKRVARTQISRYDVNGDVTLEHFDRGFDSATGKGMGIWWKNALGTATVTPTVIGATTAFRSVFTPGPKAGMSMTFQAGWPEALSPYTVRPYTYRGVKISGWEFTCNDGALAQLKCTLDAWTEDRATALTAPVFPTAQQGIFSFADATTFTLGGTPTTTSGYMTVASGVSVATVVKGITLTGTTGLATDRYGLGNAGIKREQLDNAIPTITGSLDAEFTSQAEIYTLFANNTTTTLDLSFQHGLAGTGIPYELRFTMPAIKFKTGQIKINGPDLLSQSIGFEVYDDGSGTNAPLQVSLVSKDTAI